MDKNNYAWVRTMLNRTELNQQEMDRLAAAMGLPLTDVRQRLLDEVDTHDLNDELPIYVSALLMEMGHNPTPAAVEEPETPTMVTYPHTWGELVTWANDPARTHYQLYTVANAITGVKTASMKEDPLKRELTAEAQSHDANDALPEKVQEAVEKAKLGRESFKDHVVRVFKREW